MRPVLPTPSRPARRHVPSLFLPLQLRLLMQRATHPLKCRAALAQMYAYWEP